MIEFGGDVTPRTKFVICADCGANNGGGSR
jgi:hypothetical protein